MKNSRFFLLLCFFAYSFNGFSQDTLSFIIAPTSTFYVTATQGKQFTVDWGNGTIQTYTGIGAEQEIYYSYPVWPPPPPKYTITIVGIDAGCNFTTIRLVYAYSIDASKASLKSIITSSSTLFESINLTNCTELEYLRLSSINGSKLSNIDLSDCISLKYLGVSHSQLSTLDVSNTVLDYIECDASCLPLSQIYPIFLKVLWPHYSTWWKQRLPTQKVFIGDSIDFSPEKEFGGIATNFTVWLGDWEGTLAPDSAYSFNDGIIVFHTKGTYTVKMKHPSMSVTYAPSVYATVVVAPPFQPVQEIINVPINAIAGTPLYLTGTVIPSDATYKSITWNVFDAGTTGATISGGTLRTTAEGTVIVTATIKNGNGVGKDYTQNFSIEVKPVSINEQTQKLSKINIYPNPATGKLIVVSCELRIENIDIFDVFGRKVVEQRAEGITLKEIDISSLHAGIYFVKIGTELGKVMRKVLKE